MGKDQEFMDAARNGNITLIEKVLSQRSKRAGPLASLRRGPGVNAQDSGGYTALHHACLNGHNDIVRLLLAHEASPNTADSRGSSALHAAAWAGHEDIVKMLLTHPYRPANPNLQTIENETPLHCAAQHGHTGALAVLLAHDADPNMRNTRGETPLELAAQYGRLQAVQMLIRSHPELIAPFSTAAIDGHRYSQQQKQQKTRRTSPLPNTGSVSTPSPSSPSFMNSPASPTRNMFPHTCLHLASRNGHKNVVEVLLAAGVSVNLLTPSGTALHEAALCGKESVVRTLLKAGIDLNATDAEGRTALDILKEFPPHVTKHIIAVINNFRNQMDTDDCDEVVYRHPQRNNSGGTNANKQYQKQQQQHNNHYHFNSNNHLLNHSHSMQQSSYGKQRYGVVYNGGKSLDSGLQPDDISGSSEMGVSPSSSMSSFEPPSVSPRSRSSTGGFPAFGTNPIHLTTFAPSSAPPKKPPRRNLSVSPTGQHTSPNHQLQGQRRQHRSPSNDSPYSHQSHGSVGGISLDEVAQLRARQRGERLYASARESIRSSTGVSLSASDDMLESSSYDETFVPNSSSQEITNSMKRPKSAPRGIGSISKEIINCENPILKSYNPNRKLKRNRNNGSLNQSSDSNSEPKHIPTSPTHYQQPPTPEHPPPSSSQAERTIHARIRPLSKEYKRRSLLLQQQQIKTDSCTSPPKRLPVVDAPHLNYIYARPPSEVSPSTLAAAAARESTDLLSLSESDSEHSGSDDCVEEFVDDMPFAGLIKGSAPQKSDDKVILNDIRHKQRPASNTEHKQEQRLRPPIPTKPPVVPERKFLKPVQDQHTSNNDTDAQMSDNNANGRATSNEHHQQPPKDSLSQLSTNSTNEDHNESANEEPTNNGNSEEGSILSPFNAEEARKKISEIIESFGSGILDTDFAPSHDTELDMDDLDDATEERQGLAVRLRNAGLLHLERILFENGYDNYKFVNGVFEDNDVDHLHIPEADAIKLVRFVKKLPRAEFQPQILPIAQQDNKPTNMDANATPKGVTTLSQWLNSISLPEYIESFNKHLYNTIDSVCGVWDVELQTVLEINKLGHRRRILQSLAYIRQMRESTTAKTPLTEHNETNKMVSFGPKEPQVQLAHLKSTTNNFKIKRPAPPPPMVPNTQSQQHPTHNEPQQSQDEEEEEEEEDQLQIRAPAELLLDLPANLRTKWRHSANALLHEQIKYQVYYLGSTVVKELRGTDSTRKSIQKLKRDERTAANNTKSSDNAEHQRRHKLARNSSFNRQKRALLCLAISHRGVEFIDVRNQHTICEHEIQNINCACQDSDDLKLFAYITKDADTHYCHVFDAESTDLATEIILTLGQAFEVAYQLALRQGIKPTESAQNNSILQGETNAIKLEPISTSTEL